MNRRQKEMGVRSEEPGARASSGVGDSQHRAGAWWARTRVQGKEEVLGEVGFPEEFLNCDASKQGRRK